MKESWSELDLAESGDIFLDYVNEDPDMWAMAPPVEEHRARSPPSAASVLAKHAAAAEAAQAAARAASGNDETPAAAGAPVPPPPPPPPPVATTTTTTTESSQEGQSTSREKRDWETWEEPSRRRRKVQREAAPLDGRQQQGGYARHQPFLHAQRAYFGPRDTSNNEGAFPPYAYEEALEPSQERRLAEVSASSEGLDPSAPGGAASRRAEKDAMCRDRNREYARNTRLRKKAYVQQLEQTVREMRGERDRVEEASVAATQLAEETRYVRRRALETLFHYRARGEVSESKWATILDADAFELNLPVTPYRSYDARGIVDVAERDDWRLGSGARRTTTTTTEKGGGTEGAGHHHLMAGARRVCEGIRGMIFDTASFAVMLQSIGVRSRRGHKLLRCKFELDDDGLLFDAGARVMGLWSMRTLNATSCGAKSECVKQGMLRACFDPKTNKITKLSLYFDVYAFMRELRVARDSPIIELIPNTLASAIRVLSAASDNNRDDATSSIPPKSSCSSLTTCASSSQSLAKCPSQQELGGSDPRASASSSQRSKQTEIPPRRRRPLSDVIDDGAHARVITLASRPHLITHCNRAFVDLCGFSVGETLGRSLRIIQGPATDEMVVDDLLADVARQLPASMIVVNYRRNGERFINYLRVFPLVDKDDVTHYLGELEGLDDQSVAEIENAPSPEWRVETPLPDGLFDDDDENYNDSDDDDDVDSEDSFVFGDAETNDADLSKDFPPGGSPRRHHEDPQRHQQQQQQQTTQEERNEETQ
ncbi:hypothetical protein CTAYLR_003565 [Chrysophaeum taylorii]|uniref:PAS domain-containing protein n=1 Tax=Chrysophaeum taylorii TaxID=2483200 RepID=A0AAD7UL07_9STRA|nr:hypothetical protein CTAYLR_003565 [Chrysophaeum taylorii]